MQNVAFLTFSIELHHSLKQVVLSILTEETTKHFSADTVFTLLKSLELCISILEITTSNKFHKPEPPN